MGAKALEDRKKTSKRSFDPRCSLTFAKWDLHNVSGWGMIADDEGEEITQLTTNKRLRAKGLARKSRPIAPHEDPCFCLKKYINPNIPNGEPSFVGLHIYLLPIPNHFFKGMLSGMLCTSPSPGTTWDQSLFFFFIRSHKYQSGAC